MSRRHSQKFKDQMIAMKRSGQPERSICRRYHLGNGTIARWEKELEKAKSQTFSVPLTEAQLKDVRLKELELEVIKLKEEHEIMKTALSLLCKQKPRNRKGESQSTHEKIQ
jgi:transposase-like protein